MSSLMNTAKTLPATPAVQAAPGPQEAPRVDSNHPPLKIALLWGIAAGLLDLIVAPTTGGMPLLEGVAWALSVAVVFFVGATRFSIIVAAVGTVSALALAAFGAGQVGGFALMGLLGATQMAAPVVIALSCGSFRPHVGRVVQCFFMTGLIAGFAVIPVKAAGMLLSGFAAPALAVVWVFALGLAFRANRS
ncbi:MAG: hypothetical protein ACI9WU_001105 [Myxococcota bacterium]|jgi:hypothetical protein